MRPLAAPDKTVLFKYFDNLLGIAAAHGLYLGAGLFPVSPIGAMAGIEVDGDPPGMGAQAAGAGDGPPGKGASQGKEILAQVRALGQKSGKFPSDVFQRLSRPVPSIEPDRGAAKRH